MVKYSLSCSHPFSFVRPYTMFASVFFCTAIAQSKHKNFRLGSWTLGKSAYFGNFITKNPKNTHYYIF